MSTSDLPQIDEALMKEALAKYDELYDSDGERRDKDHRRPCSKCTQPADHLSVCARCKAVRYCSRECQKKDWPEHKAFCHRAAAMNLASVCKFVQRSLDKVLESKSLDYYFQSAILHSIRSKNLEFSGEETFRATLSVGLEPVNISDFKRIMKSPTRSEWRPLGMLQILDLDVSFERDEATLNRPDLARAREALYESLLGLTKIPLVLIDIVYCKPDAQLKFHDYSYSTATPLFFANTSDADRPHTFTIPTMSGNGKGVKKPKSMDSCLEYINMKIRQDHQNKYHARMPMSREDMQALRMLMHGPSTPSPSFLSLAEGYLRKFIHEDIYEFMPKSKRGPSLSTK